MINLSTKFDVSTLSPPTKKIRKVIQNSENVVVWGSSVSLQESRSLEIAPFDRAHTSSY